MVSATTFAEIGTRAERTRRSCVAKIGHYCSDARGRRSTQRIDNQEQFNNVVVGGMTGALKYKHVLPANIFIQLYINFTIRKLADGRVTQHQVEPICNFTGECLIGIAREDHHF
jgi:hypothetical protein